MDTPARHARRRRRLAPGEVLDEEQQERIVSGFSEQAAAQAKFYRRIFAVVLAIPTPCYLFVSHYRAHPKLALTSLVSVAVALYSLRAQELRRARELRLLNVALSFLVALQAWASTRPNFERADILWLFPLSAAVSVIALEHWLQDVQKLISRLADARYELRGA